MKRFIAGLALALTLAAVVPAEAHGPFIRGQIRRAQRQALRAQQLHFVHPFVFPAPSYYQFPGTQTIIIR